MSSPPAPAPPPSLHEAPELPEGIERPPRPDRPAWKPWTAWVGLIAAFGAALVGALCVGIIGALAGADFDDPTPAVNIGATIVQDLCLVAAATPTTSGCPRSSGSIVAGVGRDRRRRPRRRAAARGARGRSQHHRAALGGLPGRGRGADRRGVLLPRLL